MDERGGPVQGLIRRGLAFCPACRRKRGPEPVGRVGRVRRRRRGGRRGRRTSPDPARRGAERGVAARRRSSLGRAPAYSPLGRGRADIARWNSLRQTRQPALLLLRLLPAQPSRLAGRDGDAPHRRAARSDGGAAGRGDRASSRAFPPLTAGRPCPPCLRAAGARAAATRRARRRAAPGPAASLPPTDEQRLLGQFGGALDRRRS